MSSKNSESNTMTMNGEDSTRAGESNTMAMTMNRENPDSEPASQAVRFQNAQAMCCQGHEA